MINTNLLTLTITDKTDETKINVELSNETMHKLYRIKEINKLETLNAYDEYIKFSDAIKELVKNFKTSINQTYLETLERVEQESLDDNAAIILLDELISSGYDYNTASKIVMKKYLK